MKNDNLSIAARLVMRKLQPPKVEIMATSDAYFTRFCAYFILVLGVILLTIGIVKDAPDCISSFFFFLFVFFHFFTISGLSELLKRDIR
jgi:hypothetical protein